MYNTTARSTVMKLELKRIGNSTGIILPKELLARLGLKQGDEITVTETPDGVHLLRTDETFDKGLEIAREVMREYHNALKELAK
jgi:putative addiction module antidote